MRMIFGRVSSCFRLSLVSEGSQGLDGFEFELDLDFVFEIVVQGHFNAKVISGKNRVVESINCDCDLRVPVVAVWGVLVCSTKSNNRG